MARKDNITLDIFTDWKPQEVVTRFEDQVVRAATLGASISKAVSATLNECDKSREDIAEAMTDWLGDEVKKNILDKYSSSSTEHIISIVRALGLIAATDDIRLLQLCAEQFGCSVIDNRFLPFIRMGELAEQREKLNSAYKAERYQAMKGLK